MTLNIESEDGEDDFGGIDFTAKDVEPAVIRTAIAEALAKIPGVTVEVVFK
jgi:hypothetical protein